MALQVFTEVGLLGDEHEDDRPVLVNRYGGYHDEQLFELSDRDFRLWRVTFRRDRSGAQTIDAFLRANRRFLYKDTDDYARTAITLEPVTSGGSVTRWRIPRDGDEGGDYPTGVSSTYVVRVGGSPVTVSSVDVDLREFILASGVSDASTVDADYEFYRLCRARRPRWRRISTVGPRFEGDLNIEEVAV